LLRGDGEKFLKSGTDSLPKGVCVSGVRAKVPQSYRKDFPDFTRAQLRDFPIIDGLRFFLMAAEVFTE
jgi:hypothetical protein